MIHDGSDAPAHLDAEPATPFSSLQTSHVQVGSSTKLRPHLEQLRVSPAFIITDLLALMFRFRLFSVLDWKGQSGFPAGPVWQTATLGLVLVLVLLHLMGTAEKVLSHSCPPCLLELTEVC